MHDQEKILNLMEEEAVPIANDIKHLMNDKKKLHPHHIANFEKSVKVPHVDDKYTIKNDALEKEMLESTQNISQPSTSSTQLVNETSKQSDRRLSCNFCGKVFAHMGDHRKHRRSHTGERPYQCNFCPRAFGQAGNLRRHCRLHSGEQPFKCPTCARGFTRSDKLTEHLTRCSITEIKKTDDFIKKI